jgi:hypothetical protein
VRRQGRVDIGYVLVALGCRDMVPHRHLLCPGNGAMALNLSLSVSSDQARAESCLTWPAKDG